jgi:predicted nucleic acid-binding protein
MGEQSNDAFAISVVTIAEIREGIESSENEIQRRELTFWLVSTAALFRQNTLPLDDPVLTDWLRLSRRLARRRIARQAPDLLLAATARVHHLIVATRNTRDFASTGVTVYNPWTDETQIMEAP